MISYLWGRLFPKLILLLLFSAISLNALCPSNKAGWTLHQSGNFAPDYTSAWGSVNFDYLQTGNDFDISVDWTSMINNHHGNTTGQLTDQEIKHLLIYGIIYQLGSEACWLPNAPQRHFTFYETTNCQQTKYVHIKCYKNRTYDCTDIGWSGSLPNVNLYNGNFYYNIPYTVVCGTQCCKQTYTVDCIDGHPQITSTASTPVPGQSCPAGDTDCLTGLPYQCTSSCQ